MLDTNVQYQNTTVENSTPKIQAFFKQIWPTIYKIINGALYFVLNLGKTIVKMSIEQLTKW